MEGFSFGISFYQILTQLFWDYFGSLCESTTNLVSSIIDRVVVRKEGGMGGVSSGANNPPFEYQEMESLL